MSENQLKSNQKALNYNPNSMQDKWTVESSNIQ